MPEVVHELIDFLLARIAEDEAAATDAIRQTGPSWTHDGMGIYYNDHPIYEVVDYTPVSEHMARHDPARVLAECAAKRRILKRHKRLPHGDIPGYFCRFDHAPGGWPCPDVRDLAAIYADHPDYRPEWAADA